jgi:hypothetical protein
MTYEELKEHYGVYKSTAKPHTFTIGSTMVMWQWGSACWDSINIKEECYTDYFRIGKVRNLRGNQIYQCILWRLCVTWGSLK